MHDYRKPKQAMETRREKRRGRGRPKKTWKDSVIDAARRKVKTFVELKRLALDRIAFSKWTEDPTLQGNRDR
jgi:predicted ArsR family transcriptional regulator